MKAKIVGSPKLDQAKLEIAEWETSTGRSPATPSEILAALGVRAVVVPWSEDPTRSACLFGFRGQLFVTWPGTVDEALLMAAHFVVELVSQC